MRATASTWPPTTSPTCRRSRSRRCGRTARKVPRARWTSRRRWSRARCSRPPPTRRTPRCSAPRTRRAATCSTSSPSTGTLVPDRRGTRRVAPLRPRAGVEAAFAEARVLDREQVVARGDAGAAVGDDRRAFDDAGLGELRAQPVGREEAAVRVDVLARRDAVRARDVAGARVERLFVAAEALALAGVDHDV